MSSPINPLIGDVLFETPEGYKVFYAVYRGPSKDTDVGAGSSATIQLLLDTATAKGIVRGLLAVSGIMGLPNGVVIEGFAALPDGSAVVVTVRNTTNAAVTINAHSVTATVLAIGV